MELIPRQSLGYLVNRAGKEMRRMLQAELTANNSPVSAEQLKVLLILNEMDGLNQQELADKVGQDKTGLTRLLGFLEEKHLVARVSDKRDKRNKLIYITNDGRKMRERLLPIVMRLLDRIESNFETQEVQIAKKVLGRIIEIACSEEEGPCPE